MSSAKWRLFRLGFNVLSWYIACNKVNMYPFMQECKNGAAVLAKYYYNTSIAW